jgi:hypothetical protein
VGDQLLERPAHGGQRVLADLDVVHPRPHVQRQEGGGAAGQDE